MTDVFYANLYKWKGLYEMSNTKNDFFLVFKQLCLFGLIKKGDFLKKLHHLLKKKSGMGENESP